MRWLAASAVLLAPVALASYARADEYVPRDIPMRFDPQVMADIDRWVKSSATS
jgi:hypothetical protein